jgi:hypothetical protein
MERLPGETDQQYVARQTRLREEAKARMAAKFGGSGMGGGSRMQGIGSNPGYDPSSGSYGGGGDFNVDSLVSGFSSMLGSASSMARNLADEQTVQSIKQTGASFWGGLTSSVKEVAASISAPDGEDGLDALQREFATHRPAASKYSGFGSDTYGGSSSSNRAFHHAHSSSAGSVESEGAAALQEAVGLPGEDRNGVERLTGESDEQYVLRQTRLRDEARARMAAKFGNGGLSSSASSNYASPQKATPTSAPGSGSGMGFSQSRPSGIHSAPSSGNAASLRSNGPAYSKSSTPPPRKNTPPRPSAQKQAMNDNDFFASFGT